MIPDQVRVTFATQGELHDFKSVNFIMHTVCIACLDTMDTSVDTSIFS